MPNYERPAFSPVEKPVPYKLVKEAAKAKVKTLDDHEREKCHVRSGGRCEVWILGGGFFRRCERRVTQNHHLIGGSGRRNKGISILADHRLDTCDKCHRDITGNVLIPVDGQLKEDAAKVRYERRRL